MKTESIKEYINCLESKNYKDIKELKIDRLSIDREILEVDLTDLLYFPNLTVLTLSNMFISYKDYIIINKLKLEILRLNNCDLVDTIEDIIKVNELVLDNTLIDTSKLNKLKKLVIRNIDININSVSCDELDVSNCNILGIENINVEKLYLTNEQYAKFENSISCENIIIKDMYNSIVGKTNEDN